MMAVGRVRFPKDELLETIGSISKNLESPVTVHLIGGLAMIFHGNKATTKDVDAIISSEEELKTFLSAAMKARLSRITNLPEDYEDLSAYYILDSESGIRLDVFLRQVCNGLVLSDEMKKRARTVLELPNLIVKICSVEDIFLFKSITMRDDDLDDMATLAGMELDWNIIDLEVKTQPESAKWQRRMHDRLLDLEEDYGVVSPLR